jgi:hypothetical protein
MYATDWSGYYPESLSELTPNYLKTLPNCPEEGMAPYHARITNKFPEYYKIFCMGDHSKVSVAPALCSSGEEYESELKVWQDKFWHGKPCPADAEVHAW